MRSARLTSMLGMFMAAGFALASQPGGGRERGPPLHTFRGTVVNVASDTARLRIDSEYGRDEFECSLGTAFASAHPAVTVKRSQSTAPMTLGQEVEIVMAHPRNSVRDADGGGFGVVEVRPIRKPIQPQGVRQLGIAEPQLAMRFGQRDLWLSDTVDFGQAVVLQGPRPQTLTLANVGPLPVTIKTITLESGGKAGFLVTGGPFAGSAIAPGKSVPLTVSFNPIVKGAVSDTLAIASDSKGSPSFKLHLTGTGIGTDDDPGVDWAVSVQQRCMPWDGASLFLSLVRAWRLEVELWGDGLSRIEKGERVSIPKASDVFSTSGGIGRATLCPGPATDGKCTTVAANVRFAKLDLGAAGEIDGELMVPIEPGGSPQVVRVKGKVEARGMCG